MFTVKIHYANGSIDGHPIYGDMLEALRYCRENISYSGGKIARVEINDCFTNSTRAVWDATWDDLSKSAGLAPSL